MKMLISMIRTLHLGASYRLSQNKPDEGMARL